MSELSKHPDSADSVIESDKTSSPWVMLTTMVLLICALTLTGLMMLNYAFARRPAMDGTADAEESGRPRLSLLPSFPKRPAAAEAEMKEEKAKGSFSGLFGTPEGSVRWPNLKLIGFGTSTDGKESFAIINNRQYHAGQMISGKVMLLEIRAHDVVVEYQGETRNLTVDTQR